MIRLAKLGLLALTVGVFSATGATDTGRLPADQLEKAVRSDAISIPTPGELFAAWKVGEDELVRSVSRANAGNTATARASRAESRQVDCRRLYRGRSKGQSAGQKHRVRHHQAGKGARG